MTIFRTSLYIYDFSWRILQNNFLNLYRIKLQIKKKLGKKTKIILINETYRLKAGFFLLELNIHIKNSCACRTAGIFL